MKLAQIFCTATKALPVTSCHQKFHKVHQTLVLCLFKGNTEVFYEFTTKMLFFISVYPRINAFIVQVNSSHGSLDNVGSHLFPICLHSSTFNFVLKRVVNVGWYYRVDDPAGPSEGFSITNGTRLVCIPPALETITWN